MPSSLVRSTSTRRTATVTTSAPDAPMARDMTPWSRYLPVPTMRRERKLRPPMVRGSSVPIRAESVLVMSCPSLSQSRRSVRKITAGEVSSSSYEVHQLDGISRGEGGLLQLSSTYDLAVELDDDGPGVEAQVPEEAGHGRGARDPPGFSVQDDLYVAHTSLSQGSNSARVAPAGSGACQSARMAATPYAPADFASQDRLGVMPPMAITGMPRLAISRTSSRPAAACPGWEAEG